MPPICLLGASGFTGVLIGRELADRGLRFVACGRDVERVAARVAPFRAAVEDVRYVDVAEPRSLAAALDGSARAITTVGPYDQLGRDVVEAAIAHRVALVDVSGEQGYVRWVHEARHDAARRSGVALVPGAGFTGAIGDLLAAVAADAAGARPEVHVSYTTGGSGPGVWSMGTRRTVAATLGLGGQAYVHGSLATEPLGEGRRLAWFPRPVGPMHAAAIPGVEAITVPRHVADVSTVRTYLAMSTWKAEALQAIGNLSRREAVRRRLARWLERDRADPSEERRKATRWACVAEARGDLGIARAWAYGRDPYRTAARMATFIAASLEDGPPVSGALSVASVVDPATALDDLSASGSLRWSVVRPT